METCPYCGATKDANNHFKHQSLVCYYSEDLADFDYLVENRYVIIYEKEREIELLPYLKRKYINRISNHLTSFKLTFDGQGIVLKSEERKGQTVLIQSSSRFEPRPTSFSSLTTFLRDLFESGHLNHDDFFALALKKV